MAADSIREVTRRLCRTAGRSGERPSDAELLGRYLAHRDEAAFAALVGRHGPVVLGVCRRVLRREADAEDAFQATFLVLARKAAGIRQRDAVGNWLYGVAYNVARRARAMDRRRRTNEHTAAEARPRPPAPAGDWHPVEAVVDVELNRLPDTYRSAVVACGLDGRTIREAAAALGWPPGTVATRLARGRAMLARRLARHGIAVPAGLQAAAPGVGLGSPVVPADLAARTARAGFLFGFGKVAPGTLSANAAALAEGVLGVMSRAKLRGLAALLVGLGLAGGFLLVNPSAADPPADPGSPATPARATPADAPKPDAARAALAALARAAAIDKLPRFDYQGRYRHGVVDTMRAVDVSHDTLNRGLTDPVLDKDWIGWYETGFSWDEKRAFTESRPGDANLNFSARFWTADEAWERNEAKDHSAIQFVRQAGNRSMWKAVHFFDYGYLRLTPHDFWWGRTVALGNNLTMSIVPPGKATWRSLGAEDVGGERCDVVDSVQRGQRLWVGQRTGHVRAALTYSNWNAGKPTFSGPFYDTAAIRGIAGRAFASDREFGNWLRDSADDDQLVRQLLAYYELHPTSDPGAIEPNEWIRFDDYREVARGVWLPFRETRTFPHSSEIKKGKHQLIRSELRVTEVRTNRDLSEQYARLLPKEGDRVQDQRFAAPVDYTYRADRTDEEIRKTADARYQEQLKDRETFRRLVQPIEAMVGKPAPALPAEGWVGGGRPESAGKPHLLHFWAVWCGPCKNDLPILKRLAEQGVMVVGMHPAGSPAREVEKSARAEGMTWPTHVAPGRDRNTGESEIAGYRAGVFPYAVLIDAKGRVAAHGPLPELVDKVGAGAMLPPRKEPGGKR